MRPSKGEVPLSAWDWGTDLAWGSQEVVLRAGCLNGDGPLRPKAADSWGTQGTERRVGPGAYRPVGGGDRPVELLSDEAKRSGLHPKNAGSWAGLLGPG